MTNPLRGTLIPRRGTNYSETGGKVFPQAMAIAEQQRNRQTGLLRPEDNNVAETLVAEWAADEAYIAPMGIHAGRPVASRVYVWVYVRGICQGICLGNIYLLLYI